jgi:anaerobic ribonucleoside-triphosphate reductase activating protein
MCASNLRVAATVARTGALGPGLRFAIWVQGCPFNCPGCVAPDFLPIGHGEEIEVSALAAAVNATADLEGITISGGEPLLQAEALALFVSKLSARLSIILFTGYDSAELSRMVARRAAVARLLTRVDVLIDGRYVHGLNDSRGLRGSRNQVVHFLTPRYRHLRDQFECGPRRIEVDCGDGGMFVGVPSLAQWREWIFG